jgi:flavodoxin
MNSLVVYSSRTGNTKKVAYAVYEALPEPKSIHPVEEAPLPDAYDFIVLGFWVDKGTADEKARQYMNQIQECDVGLFGTLGAYPDSDHAMECRQKVLELMTGNRIHGLFMCQGKVDPALVEAMAKMVKDQPDHPHAMTPERKARLAEAAKHPDEQDLINARTMFRQMATALKIRNDHG